MIRFLKDHRVEGPPEETFTAGQEVKDRSPESEYAFVRRGAAAFVRNGRLYDHEDRLVDVSAEQPKRVAAGTRAGRDRRAAPRAVTGARPQPVKKARAAAKPKAKGTGQKAKV